MLPRLGISMGDPLGIGPEIVVKALARWQGRSVAVFGDSRRLALVRQQFAPRVGWQVVRNMEEADTVDPAINLLVSGPEVTLPWGQVGAESGRASYEYLAEAVRWHLGGRVLGLVTAPIHKEAIHAAGILEPGHTEMLARLLKAPRVAMMLVGGGLRVTHVSTHVSLAEAIDRITPERIRAAVELTAETLPRFAAFDRPIAVAGLNPHNGEHGLFGDIEGRIIGPTVDQLASEGIDVEGPFAADTVFARARRQEFSAVIALYHDQGHIPVKLLAFEQAVNVTLGLPLVRTSVDHGTAMDIAGQGIANPESLLAAMALAESLTQGAQIDPGSERNHQDGLGRGV